MIFQPDAVALVLAGRKTQTRRPVRRDEGRLPLSSSYRPGSTYAVQPGRGKQGVARIVVFEVDRVPVRPISEEDAEAEGFDSPEAFYRRWADLHGARGPNECWRITFHLVG